MKINNEDIKTMEKLKEKYVLVKVEHIEELKNNNIEYTEIDEQGERFFIVMRGNRKKRFSEEMCKQIKAEKEGGKSYKEIATKYDCSTRTVNLIMRGIY